MTDITVGTEISVYTVITTIMCPPSLQSCEGEWSRGSKTHTCTSVLKVAGSDYWTVQDPGSRAM